MTEPSSDDLKVLAETRLAEAVLLLQARCSSGAYYLAGYAVECGLKAIIAKSFRGGVIPSRNLVNKVHTHDLVQLIELAGLSELRQVAAKASAEFYLNWASVSSWSEAARYDIIDELKAAALVQAVGH